MDAHTRLNDYRRRLTDIERRARDVQDRLGAVDATVTSPDGAVTVTVAPGGLLQRLVIHEVARRLSHIQLAEKITSSVAQAHAEAARAAADVLTPLLGERSSGMDLVRAQLPATAAQDRR
jgi:DNA-binding protein YbaB